jgi:hypothetical protein
VKDLTEATREVVDKIVEVAGLRRYDESERAEALKQRGLLSAVIKAYENALDHGYNACTRRLHSSWLQ